MKHARFGLTLGVKEHLLAGHTITRLEALILYGVSNLPDVIKEMRRAGWTIESRTAPFAAAVKRINEHAVLEPPSNLPVREIQLTEYWLSK